MTRHISENFSTWLVEWSPVGITGNALPPRDPNDDDEDDEDEEDEDEEPAVVREPDDDSFFRRSVTLSLSSVEIQSRVPKT